MLGVGYTVVDKRDWSMLLPSLVGAASLGVSWVGLRQLRCVSGSRKQEVERRAGLGRRTRALGHGTCENSPAGESDALGPQIMLPLLAINTGFQSRVGKGKG